MKQIVCLTWVSNPRSARLFHRFALTDKLACGLLLGPKMSGNLPRTSSTTIFRSTLAQWICPLTTELLKSWKLFRNSRNVTGWRSILTVLWRRIRVPKSSFSLEPNALLTRSLDSSGRMDGLRFLSTATNNKMNAIGS
ncbi:hypothetical protein EMPG_15043 [Blastomyces silverae]|uniref:Uncharacterized protein n=1 Tax=Blastomyces silverae TaxID=2060906 RepID=A0A0H1BDL6_9EURO|nr:hypothetical protein EMPG_15043 [Blastomyces silverae]